MGMARGECQGDRDIDRVRGETVAGPAILGRSELATRSLLCRHRSRLRHSLAAA